MDFEHKFRDHEYKFTGFEQKKVLRRKRFCSKGKKKKD